MYRSNIYVSLSSSFLNPIKMIYNFFTIFFASSIWENSYKIFLKEDHQGKGLVKGWNTRYITDLAKSVRFDVRGRVYTRQLDYFVECIEQERSDNISSFAEAVKTDIIMDEIRKDAARSLAGEDVTPQTSPILANETKRSSMWRRIFK